MKKLITLCLTSTIVAGVFALSSGETRVNILQSAADINEGVDASPVFYASMHRSDEWGQQGSTYSPKYGMYSIPADEAESYTRVFETASSMVTDGGFYLDGKYYWVTSNSVGSAWMDNYASVYHISDAETFAEISSVSSQKALVFGSDFTYDYIGGYGYAVGATSYSSSSNPLTSSELRRIDVESGTFTSIGSNSARVKALACDGNGQLWGIGLPLDISIPTYLYKIDKNTGSTTIVATIDKNLYSATATSATFDLRDGKLYWSATTYVDDELNQRTYESAIYEVNLTTGATTTVRSLENNEVLVGMILKDSHPKAPQAVKALSFDFDAGSTSEGKVTFTLPTETFDHTQLTAPLSATISIDGNEHTVTDLTPGQAYESDNATLSAEGTHVVTVYCYKDNLKSLPATIEPYAGVDTPAAVTDIKIDATIRGDRATISWTAPSTGASGGYIDTDQLTYTVIRRPDMVTLASGLKDTQYTDELDRVMALTQYEIKAVAGDAESESAYSGSMLLGTAYPIPYLETFDTNTNFLTYTVIDNNNDANDTDGGTWYWNQANFNVMYFTNLAQADDYLITPTLDLRSDKVYKFQAQIYGYTTGCDCHFTVNIGNAATVEAQSRQLAEEQFASSKNIGTFYTLFRPDEGECRISIHNISDGSDHMYIDNILVSEYGTIDIPNAPEHLSATMDGNEVKITFTTPSTSVKGDALTSLKSVKIYRAGELSPAATLTDVRPATEMTWNDATPGAGLNQYIITAENEAGDGLEADLTIDTNKDIPRAVTNITISSISSNTEAEVTWQQSLVGINGRELSQSDISYDVYRNIGVYKTLIAADLEGLSFIDRGLADAFGEKRQEYVAYTIIPKTNGGTGAEAKSATSLLGKPFDLPYAESWTNQSVDTYPWIATNSTDGGWVVASTGYDPYTQGQDGSGLATFYVNRSKNYGQSDYISPRIDISNYRNARISFYLYHSNSTNCSNSKVQIGLNTDDKGTVMISDVFNVYASESGWQQHTVDIPAEYADCNRISLVFRGSASSYLGSVHIDNVTVTGTQPAHEVKIDGITGPEQCLIGSANNYIVDVTNIGSEVNGDITVRLFVDGAEVGTETIGSIASGSTQKIGFFYTPGIDNKERIITVSAEIDVTNDESLTNNSFEITSSLVAPMLPYVADLSGESYESKALLSWSDNTVYPHQEYVLDDVESHPAFAIDGLEGWTFVDVDNAAVAKLSLDGTTIVQWENTGEPQAFIVFNTVTAGTSSVITPRSGSQCFISWESTATSGNDDWMISPLLSAEAQTISFYAKALYPQLLDERFEVWVSYGTNDDLAQFVRISGNSPVTVSSATEWTKYSYKLQEGVRYFAIRCVSQHQFGLMIDDISYSPAYTPLEFWGYNVYRDGELLTEEAIGDPEYEDSDVTVGETYRYNVTALYDTGETIYSNDVYLTISDMSGIDQITTDNGTVNISVIPGGIRVTGADGRIINVYSVNGTCINSIRGTGHDLLPLPAGLYIVSVDNTSAKVAVK